jgi:hypothetical protein
MVGRLFGQPSETQRPTQYNVRAAATDINGRKREKVALAEVAVTPDVHFSGVRVQTNPDPGVNPGIKTLFSVLVIVSTIRAAANDLRHGKRLTRKRLPIPSARFHQEMPGPVLTFQELLAA